MKKFIIALSALILLYLAYDTARYRLGWYIDLKPDEPVTAFMTTDTQSIYMDRGSGPEPFTVKGVNLGVGLPGEWATDYAIDRETYLRWFGQMQEMGANTVRVYITLHDDFYNAFYEYNTAREEANEEPLWLIHGVWVNDYIQNSHRDAYDKDFLDAFIEDGRTLVDVLHGNKKISLGRGTGSGFYNKDVSRWVIGYILGVEWEDVTAPTPTTSIPIWRLIRARISPRRRTPPPLSPCWRRRATGSLNTRAAAIRASGSSPSPTGRPPIRSSIRRISRPFL